MKHRICSLFLVGAFLLLAAAPALAHDYDSDSSDHWLRYAAYAVHPFGVALEYGVTRPIHWLVSRPHLCVIFGHKPHPGDKYFEWDNCGAAEHDCGGGEDCDDKKDCGDGEDCDEPGCCGAVIEYEKAEASESSHKCDDPEKCDTHEKCDDPEKCEKAADGRDTSDKRFDSIKTAEVVQVGDAGSAKAEVTPADAEKCPELSEAKAENSQQ